MLTYQPRPGVQDTLKVFYASKYIGDIYLETHGEFVFDYFDGDARGKDLEGYSTWECLKELAEKLEQMNKERNPDA